MDQRGRGLDGVGMADPRRYLSEQVAERIEHRTAEDVRTTCSFARAERLLEREYHGRFLIELLQNAADAWRADDRSAQARSRVAISLTEGPALLVANQGVPLTAEVVISALGHIGATTKAEGEAIGHKGIGFKSVLEMTLVPELYSGLQEHIPALAVAFDPLRSLEEIRSVTPWWDAEVAQIAGLDREDPVAAVPVLRYPRWVDELPAAVEAFAADGYDTVVRLPFDARSVARLGLDEPAWLEQVRAAMERVTDEIVLLLGTFAEVALTDELAGEQLRIVPRWSSPVPHEPDSGRSVLVVVERDEQVSSRWRLHRRQLPAATNLAGEIAVGLRLDEASPSMVLPAVEGADSAPFHLFFPTRIASGFPFLLHGYFEVNAARTGFYGGSQERNYAILDELVMLAGDAVAEAAASGTVDLVSLVDLVAACGVPEEPLAQRFHARLLGRLDEVAWIPTPSLDGGGRIVAARPGEVLVDGPELTRQLTATFPPGYVHGQVSLRLPDRHLSDAALLFLAGRQPEVRPELWDTLATLLRPGDTTPWQGPAADTGFLALLDLVEHLRVTDRKATERLLQGLAGDPASTLVPVVADDGQRRLLPVPNPEEGTAGRRQQLILARVRRTATELPVPPAALEVAFLPDGLLTSEAAVDRARPFGVRPFTVNTVLDRLSGLDPAATASREILPFLWQLLARERLSEFGTARSAGQATTFDPDAWFWCRPGRAREDDTARQRQQRERYLAQVPVPCRDGAWRPAGRVAFGSDWADWLAAGNGRRTAATEQRIACYRALEEIAPGPGALLAAPETVLELLDERPFEIAQDEQADDAVEVASPDEPGQRDAERQGFLFRLGVWQVPPIEAYESRADRGKRFPWDGPLAERQRAVLDDDGHRFGLSGWSGSRHHNTRVAEDYRFLWSLEDMAARNLDALLQAVRAAAPLYRRRRHLIVRCRSCRASGTRHATAREGSSEDGYPSLLALELRTARWIPASLDGTTMDSAAAPERVWWREQPPAGSGLLRSPWRLVPICGPGDGVDDAVRDLAGVNQLGTADLDTLRRLLASLREQLEEGRLPADPRASSSARQALEGLHRRAYERLAVLAADQSDEVAATLEQVGVLCQIGDGLEHFPPAQARHDDGRHAAYVRHFTGTVPLVVLPRDASRIAATLQIPQFKVELQRRGDDDGRDVTGELTGLLGERIAELLAIMIHHSLGTQTLDLGSTEFEERSRRLRNLRVIQVDQRVIDAVAEGPDQQVTIGGGTEAELYLEGGQTSAPILYHDIAGDNWIEQLRRRLAPHLAVLLDNAAYTHTFALFLQADTPAAREEFLLEIGISGDEVARVEAQIGVVGEAERERHRRWFTAVLALLGDNQPVSALDQADLQGRLAAAGLPADIAQLLVEAGGGEAVRHSIHERDPLLLLDSHGVDLNTLHQQLLQLDDSGLRLSVAWSRFHRWLSACDQHLAAVLATTTSDEAAKRAVRDLHPPEEHALDLDPPMTGLLAPAVTLLRDHGLDPDSTALAEKPAEELLRLSGLPGHATLDERTRLLYDAEERQRALRERAGTWRRELRLLGVLARTGSNDPRSRIQTLDAEVDAELPTNPTAPSQLRPAGQLLFRTHSRLWDHLDRHLTDELTVAIPERSQLLAWAADTGIATDRLARVENALDAPRRTRVRRLLERGDQLTQHGLAPTAPPGLEPLPPVTERPAAPGTRKPVPAIKVDASHDRRKRQLGDGGEQWALASVLNQLAQLDADALGQALDDIEELLASFSGTPIDTVRGHLERARSRSLDDEERIEELSQLLHVAHHSDGFGFDLLGWLPTTPGSTPQALCLEVKSSSGEGFQLSRGEWNSAKRFKDRDQGHRYGILVVRRSKGGGPPAAMDLLLDPIGLHESGQLQREADSYKLTYRATPQ